MGKPMRPLVSALFLGALALSGCGSNEGPHASPTVQVKGKITYQGKPMSKGEITFEPVNIGREAQGAIQSDGTYVMTTFKKDDGAVPGVHRVAITGMGKSFPRKYQSAGSSKVEVEVVEGKTEYNIDLK